MPEVKILILNKDVDVMSHKQLSFPLDSQGVEDIKNTLRGLGWACPIKLLWILMYARHKFALVDGG
jgi:hypothetical protein